MDDLRLYRKFKQIAKARENEGYLEWKDEVIREVEELDDHLLINLFKRYEILCKKCQKSAWRTGFGRNINREIYYEELLEILRKELERRSIMNI